MSIFYIKNITYQIWYGDGVLWRDFNSPHKNEDFFLFTHKIADSMFLCYQFLSEAICMAVGCSDGLDTPTFLVCLH